MQIQLLNTTVDQFDFKRTSISQDDFQLEFATAFSKEESNTFIVRFKIEYQSIQGYQFTLVYVAEFETSEEITESFKTSHFPAVNAPAIAFPFLRSFVSLFTLNAGFDAVFLPSINFSAVYADKIKEEAGKI